MPTNPHGFHHRLYPYMEELVQYATENPDDPDDPPWIVRDRSAALRNERRGEGRALVRVWAPSEWVAVTRDENKEKEKE